MPPMPAIFTGIVAISFKYIASGSLLFSPILNAGAGVTGERIRSQFSNIRLGDENGAATADPGSAVFFEFEFQEDADTFGSVSISLADGENMKVYYNRDLVSKIDEDSRDEWYAFLKELKDFAVEHQMRFDVRDITKNNLTKQDYENLADTNKTVNTDEMSEELARITKLEEDNIEKAYTYYFDGVLTEWFGKFD